MAVDHANNFVITSYYRPVLIMLKKSFRGRSFEARCVLLCFDEWLNLKSLNFLCFNDRGFTQSLGKLIG